MTPLRSLHSLLTLRSLLPVFLLCATHGVAKARTTPPADIATAMELCAQADIRSVEGIWHFPDDEVTILIWRSPDFPDRYDMTVLEADDTSLSGGDRIGFLESSPDPSKFSMTLCTEISNGMPRIPRQLLATYTAERETIVTEWIKIRISLKPSRLLPYFWKFAGFRFSNPLDRLPHGLQRLFPSYDGNGNSRRTTIYY